jgi:hypothetical protein
MCWRVDTNKQRMVPAQSINQTFVTANHNQEHLSQPITIKRICHNQSQSRAFVTTNRNQYQREETKNLSVSHVIAG